MNKSKDRKHSEKKAWLWFSKMKRLEASDAHGYCKCYTCSAVKFWKEIDVGHYYPQGVNKALKFDERNTRCQEVSCNRFKSGNLTEYAANLVKEYGPTIFDELKAKRVMKVKINQSAFEIMAQIYKDRALMAAKQRGLEI